MTNEEEERVTHNDSLETNVVLARQQATGPAIGLLITGIVGAFFALFTVLGIGLGSLAMFGRRWIDDVPDWYGEMFEGAFAMGSAVVGLAVAVFIIFAALKMKDLQQWGLAVAAAVLAMLPCISPCCLIGLPVGIWSLVVLMRPEIKSAFS